MFLNFRYQPVGGGIRPAPVFCQADPGSPPAPSPVSDLISLSQGRDIIFGIHGYNNHQGEGICAMARLTQLLSLPPRALFLGILWPGDSRAGFISYPVEKPTASQTGRNLAAFCNTKLGGAASFSFVSHSLGARVALEAIRGMSAEVQTVCLMAAAIERTCLEKEYVDAFARVKTLSVLASRRDRVLRYAFAAGNLVGDILDPTSDPLSTALGYAGPKRAVGATIPPWLIDSQDGYDHSDYLPSSDPTDAFPIAGGKYVKTAAFARRAFMQEPQIWPEIPAPPRARGGWWKW